MLVRPSDPTPAAKRKDPKQPSVKTTSSEPPVKRRKHSLPSDATTDPIVIHADDAPVESAKHGKVTSIPVRKQPSRKKLALSSTTEDAASLVDRMPVDESDDTDELSPGELGQLTLQHSKDVHAQQKKKISKLEAELVEQRAFTEQAQNRVKQDMMMDIMREKEKLRKFEEAGKLAKRLHEKEISEYKVKLEKAAEKSLVERTRTLSAQRAIESYRLEAEHLQHLNATFQSDLQDLRVVDVEDRRARKDRRRDLPPAYGNLDDEECFPPYSQQADAGSIELANLKREIRRKFERKVDQALANPDKGSNTFCLLSAALQDVSQSLTTILDFAKDVPVSHAHMQSITSQNRDDDARENFTSVKELLDRIPSALAGAPILVPDRPIEISATDERKRRKQNKAARPTAALIQSANAAPYVADRITKLLLELLWRTVSACELRPGQGSVDAMFDHTLPVMHTSIDEAVVKALRLAFLKSHPLTEFQNYLTQFDILAKKFKTLGIGMTLGVHNALTHFDFLPRTLLWLNEQVEKERELKANETVEKRVPFQGFDDDDGVSTRWEGSDTSDNDSGSE
ncbi:hypothetical protein MBLNU13_g07735t1 [Cladosporium sp. NU13]